MAEWQRRRLLIWGTTSPEFSKKHYETVCTGAIDRETGKLMRIYPITLRHLNDPFHLYDWIEANVMRNTSDFRPESHKIDQSTIQVIESIPTKGDGWERRAEWVLREGNVFPSLEALQDAQGEDHTSLGLVKPKRIVSVRVVKKPADERAEWEEKKAEAVAQKDLFVDVDSVLRELTFNPVEYRVKFDCNDERCTGHDLKVLDWGVDALARRGFGKGGAALSEQWVIDKLREVCDLEKKDLYLFLGNTKAHAHLFSIVGFFWPPLPKPEPEKSQLSLLG